ncbi:MAG: hypothetical protein JW869_06710 [Candidatus Omnitrophica bacterium]|nr:hypothetical protein [Candidatus Omnitrophota bacterium]
MYKVDRKITIDTSRITNHKRRITNRGFTLFETILVAGMLSVVGLAIYSTFNSGLQIWERLTQRMPTEELNVFIEKITDDLNNSFSFSEAPFIGLQNNVSFATLVLAGIGQEQEEFLSVGRVSYYYNPRNKTLNRQQYNYSDIYQNEIPRARQIMQNVMSAKFTYYCYDPAQDLHGWKEMWFEEDEEARIPLAVRMEIEFVENEQEKKVRRTIAIPSATQFHYSR